MARAFGPRRAVRVDVGQGAGPGATALSAAELAAFERLDAVYRALCALLYDYVPTTACGATCGREPMAHRRK